eukprot:4332489-Pyramimonas_sp.AAC.1
MGGTKRRREEEEKYGGSRIIWMAAKQRKDREEMAESGQGRRTLRRSITPLPGKFRPRGPHQSSGAG